MPKIAFLTEAGRGVGLGHVKRCVALGTALVRLGAGTRVFVGGDGIPPALQGAGDVVRLAWTAEPERAFERVPAWRPDAVVVDSYAATPEFLDRLRALIGRVIVVDDLADRRLPADVVVNGAYHAKRLTYAGLPATVLLLGPEYALLDPAFADPPPPRGARDVRRALVTLGGDAPGDVLRRAVDAVSVSAPSAALDVVTGPFSAATLAAGPRIRIHGSLGSLRGLMLDADLAVTASGMTLYECLATGTPTVGVCLADNQRPAYEALSRAGLVVAGEGRLEDAVGRVVADAALRQALSARGRAVVDGEGAGRVAREIVRVCAADGVVGRR